MVISCKAPPQTKEPLGQRKEYLGPVAWKKAEYLGIEVSFGNIVGKYKDHWEYKDIIGKYDRNITWKISFSWSFTDMGDISHDLKGEFEGESEKFWWFFTHMHAQWLVECLSHSSSGTKNNNYRVKAPGIMYNRANIRDLNIMYIDVYIYIQQSRTWGVTE